MKKIADILSLLKHVGGVEGYFRHLQHTSTYIALVVWLKSPKSQLFKTFFQVENQLNIKKVKSKNVISPYSVFGVSFDTFDTPFDFLFIRQSTQYIKEFTFDTSNMSNITLYTVLCQSRKHHFQHLQHTL